MIEFVSQRNIDTRWWSADVCHLSPYGYYFWDEVGQLCYGPFASKKGCSEGMAEYAKTLDPQ